MASSSVAATATTADTPINLKINIDGTTRRLKLPLRDLGAHVFEDKLRAILHIPADVDATVERYSDSATSYVTLNRANIAVYKQLYRAAKAKQKLKLRVTTKQPVEPAKEVAAPKPVTVEDEPEEEPQKASLAQAEQEPKEEAAVEMTEASAPETPAVADTVVAPQTNQDFPTFVRQWRARGNPRIHLRRNGDGVEVIDFLQPSATTEPLVIRDSSAGATPPSITPSQRPASLASLARGMQVLDNFAINDRNSKDRELLASLKNLRRIAKDSESPASASATTSPDTSNNVTIKLADPSSSSNNSVVDFSSEQFEASKEISAAEERDAKANAIKEIMARSMRMTVPSVPTRPGNDVKPSEVLAQESMKRPFTVCCNSCDRAVPEAHFHCSICDEGDFDLCQDCVNRGISCHGDGHWLIKRTVVNGNIKCSSTHIAPKSLRSVPLKIAQKPVTSTSSVAQIPALFPARIRMGLTEDCRYRGSARTCNSCVQEFQEAEFVHCTSCDDYDLCKGCFAKNQHGHHPKHGFTAAVKGTVLDEPVSSRLAPGRNVLHNAICDGCDKYVRGIRHKCLDCPDWDYCSDCVKDANFIHADHRFVAIYEPLADRSFSTVSRATHFGISCDGPLCKSREGGCKYIVGERYKCAVCHDTDFCANCEASPANTHNKTHPLIKFKTPVRHVSVTTTGEHEDGQRLPTMGDKCHRSRTSAQSADTQTSPKEKIAATPVQTVVDVQPTEQPAVPLRSMDNSEHIKEEASETKPFVPAESPKESPAENDLVAIFKWDTIQDGSVLPPNHTFEQTWVLRNEGTMPWPAGCSVKFVGGDYMGAVDPAHPAGIHELVSASESTVCYNALNPGQEFPFTVLMRTPDRNGKVISYWRLTTPEGVKFGHKLWCDVVVDAPPKPEQGVARVSDATKTTTKVEETAPETISESQMIIPKLEHESPSGSTFMDGRPELEVETETETLAASADDEEEDFEDCGQDDWAEDSASGFMTDEEYDILDASDEEFLFEQQKMLSKK
ncbi:hypothetical protein F5B22DRAFT_626064 [Xylaria bambusicola]|uniref:uncharacterized protein n=1 Tax=Xylaria bambusicola TaxID=326684 RepID=UPI002008D236|nr:uncharacterized protein F5B22DRAFT_626064 [Xylaria bambusicola]KAI0505949.1 hypothetical protein F5B22DRAFT_626064 [Xylaria bambusicola]